MNTHTLILFFIIGSAICPLMAQSATPVQQESALQSILRAGQDYSEHRAREKRIERRDERYDRDRKRRHHRDERHRHHRHR